MSAMLKDIYSDLEKLENKIQTHKEEDDLKNATVGFITVLKAYILNLLNKREKGTQIIQNMLPRLEQNISFFSQKIVDQDEKILIERVMSELKELKNDLAAKSSTPKI